jgi:SOS-response transcriptional repressor LexA
LSSKKLEVFTFSLIIAEIFDMSFIERLETLLKKKGISQKSLAEYIGIRNPSISEWKKEGTIPRADVAIGIAKFLDVSVEYLITGEDKAGLTPEQRDLLRNYDQLDTRDRQTVLDLIDTMLKRQQKGEESMYPAAQPPFHLTKDPEPVYLQPVKVQKKPKIDNNVAAFVPVHYIPFYGKVAAGRPIDINIPPDRVIPVPAPVLKGDKTRYFSVEVKGTSMTNAGILDGDYVIIRRVDEPEDGKVMLVRYGNESTVKRIRLREGKVLLCWEDGSGEIIEVDSSEYEVQGEFVKLMRDID